jgi:hypothetical protein
MSIIINSVDFLPHPDIGVSSNPKLVNYAFDYVKLVEDIANKRYARLLFNKELGKDVLTEQEEEVMRQVGAQEKAHPGSLESSVFRMVMAKDLWFLLYFIVKPFAFGDKEAMARVNHPFVVKACDEVQNGPKDNTLDVWARFHYKSSIITIGETIQYQLLNPEHATGLFSHKAPISKNFLFTIMTIFENEEILRKTYPDVVWNDVKEAPLWSLDRGIVLKRKSNRKEPSVSAHGLVEGMPTALHFERRVYDDISTNDMAFSKEIIDNVNRAFDISSNLKTLTGSHHRVVGTYYSHMDPLIRVRDMKKIDGTPMYYIRFKPATEDGTRDGVPVLMTQEELDVEKPKIGFNCQQLLDPTPHEEQKLNPDYLQPVEPSFIPSNVFRFMLIDQAGDAGSNKTKDGDAWAVGVLGVEPSVDDVGQSRVFLENLWVEAASESEAIDQIVRMYLDAGIVARLGVEKVGISTTHIHIQKALKAKGRYVDFDETDNNTSSGVLLRPAGRHKKKFIEASLSWPLNNSKLYYSTKIKSRYIERLKQEMTNFPLWHDDALNMMAYLYDVIKEYHFQKPESEFERMRRRREQQAYDPLTFGMGENAMVV